MLTGLKAKLWRIILLAAILSAGSVYHVVWSTPGATSDFVFLIRSVWSILCLINHNSLYIFHRRIESQLKPTREVLHSWKAPQPEKLKVCLLQPSSSTPVCIIPQLWTYIPAALSLLPPNLCPSWDFGSLWLEVSLVVGRASEGGF